MTRRWCTMAPTRLLWPRWRCCRRATIWTPSCCDTRVHTPPACATGCIGAGNAVHADLSSCKARGAHQHKWGCRCLVCRPLAGLGSANADRCLYAGRERCSTSASVMPCLTAGVDWRNAANWDCNERMSPLLDSTYDGLSVHPLEVMFMPVDELSLRSGIVPATAAKRYDQWSVQQASMACILSCRNSSELICDQTCVQ